MEEKGVWRTISGRRVFIREGEDLTSAMKRSGKFKGLTEKAMKMVAENPPEFQKAVKETNELINEQNKKDYMKKLNDISKKEYENKIDKTQYDEEIKKATEDYKNKKAYNDYVKKTLNNDEYLQANRPNEYFLKQMRESGIKTFADEIKEERNTDDISPMSEYSDTTGTGLSDKQHSALSKMSMSEMQKLAKDYNIDTKGLSKKQLMAKIIAIFND